MCNKEIREALHDHGMPLWRLADAMDVSEATIIRWLRHELPDDRKKKMLLMINSYKEADGDE